MHLTDRPWVQYGRDKVDMVFEGRRSLERGVLPFIQAVPDPATAANTTVQSVPPAAAPAKLPVAVPAMLPVVSPPVPPEAVRAASSGLAVHVPALAPPAAQSAGGESAQALRIKHTARRVEGPVEKGKATAQRGAAHVQQQKVEALAQQRLRPLSLEELHYI